MDSITRVPAPVNETVLDYAPGSPERTALNDALATLATRTATLHHVIGGRPVAGAGAEIDVRAPHDHKLHLGTLRNATPDDARAAVEAARAAAPAWRALPYDERAAVFLRAADLLAGPWRARLVAATMLGQSKTSYQAEIDAACELIDFWRFNAHFGRLVLGEQPVANSRGVWNRTDHRPLEGFVYAITPFNFTAIAGNLPTAPALMGNTVVWKPSPTQQLAASLTMELLQEAGLPAGVVNMVAGDGLAVSEVVLDQPDLAGIHFTGSTATFRHLWRETARRVDAYASYPRLVGETGGKDFVLAAPDADPVALRTALVRGAFEYQGQKCSAASRAYVPSSLWDDLREELATVVDSLPMGDVRDHRNFIGAVIDERAFAKHRAVLDEARADPSVEVVAGGTYDDSRGWFVRPTVLRVDDPEHPALATEYFGPILAVHVYDDSVPGAVDAIADLVDATSPYALTGAVFATDRTVVHRLSERLRFAAGNFYVNDKPTGAVVGQQPFGGARASGTNDKAGAATNLLRWTSPRSIKETFVPAAAHEYPHMQDPREVDLTDRFWG
ncbi:L-glutamate gamma-semialdehyde dehydrogenase [Nocardioides sp. SLBN-35]|uniref:L-glutamate gamma-semialdehyde dehydrogenase n=1 Tax=Nocardioides sp. SLBN-35 TaxID=2768445 RepID=UPI001154D122|nr:L-glutamate gamma-semialdehyde dehydrogenase [Nocardioides sp. SLBN-35]TQK68446.1 delta-1-pyrroline-5-carboxylate dehydrogenase [Nocardioides sp. SLBN-35]